MSETLVWWFVLQVIGLAALPLCVSLFRNLPDRGYTLSKAFALIILGYVFWISNVMRIMPNTSGGIWLCLFLVVAASALLFWRRRGDIESALRERLWLIGVTEVVFFLAFVTAAYLRSFVPDLGGTEKPMDFMFLNAVTHGEGFPPEDPWLAGNSVSYYYLGYLLVSIVTRLSGVGTGIGFNLGLATIAALAMTGAFGLVYNLAAPREREEAEAGPGTPAAQYTRLPWRAVSFGVLAALLLAVMGNLTGVLEALASHGVGPAGFWQWVDVRDLAPYESTHWWPDQYWFWWHATRILDLGEGIHEFPFFSFLLGDMHPHVMAIPFVLLAAGVALNLFRSDEPLDLVVWLERPLWLAAFAVILGGLAFLNTWDMPTMAFVVTLTALLRNRLLGGEWSWALALDTGGFVLPLFLAGALAYTPFFFGGFASQASGFTAEGGAGSGLFHSLLIWGVFATIVLPYAVWRITRSDEPLTVSAVLWSLAPAVAVVLLWAVWDGLAAAFGWLPPAIRPNEAHVVGSPDVGIGLGDRLAERGWNWLTALLMGGSVGLLGLALVRETNGTRKDDDARTSHVFALALAVTASLLILGAEFIYIEDVFSRRLNTIFKLYYQAWILLSIASGFVLYELSRAVRVPRSMANFTFGDAVAGGAALFGVVLGIVIGEGFFASVLLGFTLAGTFLVVAGSLVLLGRSLTAQEGAAESAGILSWHGVWAGAASVVLIGGFVYPLLATYNRTDSFDLPRGLNGLDRTNGDDRAAIDCLAGVGGHPVIAEALGESYSEGGRISAATGFPTLLQWPGHQRQWRGSDEPAAGRREDIELLYTASSDEEARAVVDKYGVRYVVVGELERQSYPGLTVQDRTGVFEPFSTCNLGQTALYRVRAGTITTEVSTE